MTGAGLLLATYGDRNSDTDTLALQHALGVAFVITDDIAALSAARQRLEPYANTPHGSFANLAAAVPAC